MKKELILVLLTITVITAIFFYPIFKGHFPFPGDLLVGQYAPYNTNSYFGIAPGGIPNKGQSFDTIRILFPWKEFAVKNLAHGELPFWNPYNFSGTPFLANFQGGTFYPLNILFLFLPVLTAWTIYIIAEPFLAFFFTYLLLKEFKLSRTSSLFGGFVFAFSSYMAVWLEYGNFGHALLWFPLILLLIQKILKKPKILYIISLILSLLLSILAGYIQITIYVFFFSFVFLLFKIFSSKQKNPWKKIIFFTPIFIIPALLSAPQLFPTLELFFQSARTPYTPDDITRLLIPLPHIITTFVPDFFGNPVSRNYWLNGTYIERISYVGTIPLFFIIYALFTKKKTSIFWFFAAIAGLVYFISFNNPVSHFFYTLPLPFINTTVPTRMMFIFCFAAAVCAAYGFSFWEKENTNKLKPLIILGSIYLLCWIIVLLAPHFLPQISTNFEIAKRNLILPTVIFTSFIIILYSSRFIKLKKLIILLIFTIAIFDLFYFFNKITPFAPAEFFYPDTPVMAQLKKIQEINRSWGNGSAYIDTNFQTHERTFSTDGYDPLFIRDYARLISGSEKGLIPDKIPRTDVDIAKTSGTENLNANPYRQKILNLLGIKYILNKNDQLDEKPSPDYSVFDPQKYRLIWQKSAWQIYENREALPRIFLTYDYLVLQNKNQIIKTIFSKRFDPHKTIILEENLPHAVKLIPDKKATIKLTDYTPNKVILKTNSKTDSLLFMSDNYYPGWNVTVDGKNSKLYKADYTFRAVFLQKGSHSVIFSFYPKSFDIGLKTSISVLLLLIIGLIIAKKKKILI